MSKAGFHNIVTILLLIMSFKIHNCDIFKHLRMEKGHNLVLNDIVNDKGHT